MKDLIKKEILTEEELEQIDNYFSIGKCDELLELDNKIIINFIDKCEDILGYCLTSNILEDYLVIEATDAKLLFDPENMDYYYKILELVEYFSLESAVSQMLCSLGDFFYNNDNVLEAKKYYKKAFKNGFDLCGENYYDSLANYIKSLNKNPSEELKELINSSPKDETYSYDFTNVYLLLIINLEKFSDEYLFYINEAIEITTVVVRNYQKNRTTYLFDSGSDEERNLCELLALKMEYYVEKRDYIKSFEMYKQLTEEIVLSDCTRYYHVRSEFYRKMLKYMSEEYPKLKFFENIGYYKFKVLNAKKYIQVDDIITLEKKNGLTFEFKVVSMLNDDEYVIHPILPLIGEGEHIFTKISFEEEDVFLTNMLIH